MSNNSNTALYNLLGICALSGNIVSGGEMVEDAVRRGKAHLVIVTEDIGNSMLKAISDNTEFYSVPLICFGEKEQLGKSIGKGPRSEVEITYKGLAKSFSDKYQTQHPGVN